MTARLLFALSLLTVQHLSASAQRLEFAPGAQYDARIPSLKSVTGHDFGSRVTTPEEIIRYLKALNEAAPDRTRLIKYAESWEGRELYAIVIADADRVRRLDEIKAGLRRLAHPASLSPADAEGLIKPRPPARGGRGPGTVARAGPGAPPLGSESRLVRADAARKPGARETAARMGAARRG